MKIIGFHIDLKAQMPKFPYICRIIERIADMGYNTVLLEYQDKFPYFGELSFLASPDALTVSQVEEIKRLCRSRNIEIIPMMQCLGHMYWVTRFDKYAHLGEHFAEKGRGSHSLCASKKDSLELFRSLALQVMSLHGDSKYFHIGADEVKFSPLCPDCQGKQQADILAKHYGDALGFVKSKGYTPVMWGDMVLKYDGLADMLPKDTVIMDWDYTGILSEENGREFYGKDYISDKDSHVAFENTKRLLSKGFDVICAPAVRSMGDTVYMPRNAHLDNCVQGAYTAKKSDAYGVIVTSWAVRRVPHILTEPILSATALLCKGEKLTYPDVLSIVSEKYLGENDIEYGKIPFEFATLLNNVQATANLLSSGQDFMDADSGMFLSDSIEKRLCGEKIYKNEKIRKSCTALLNGCHALLEKIKNPDRSEYTEILVKSLESASALGQLFAYLCDNAENGEMLAEAEKCIDILKILPDILSEYYTEFSMPTEYMARLDVYKEYVQQLLTDSKRSTT